MSKITPFSAWIPRPDLAAKIACPPYDVVTSNEAQALTHNNPYSFLHITKAEIDFEPGTDENDRRVPFKARDNLSHFMTEGWLTRDISSFYIYRMESEGHIQTGLVCAVSAYEYDAGLIKKHEKTRKEKEDDRTRLAITLNAHVEPVLLVCKHSTDIAATIKPPISTPPLFNIIDMYGVRHTLWRAQNPYEIEKIFSKQNALYIADGHHRSAVASRIRATKIKENPSHTGTEPYNFFPAVIFPDNEVRIYRYDWEGPLEKRPLANVSISDIMALADAGGIMPPKSTWFAPKLASGLLVYVF